MAYLLSHLLTESARCRSDHPAVSMEGVTLSYGELDSLTDRLAATLGELGVRRGDRVGLYVHKSIASIIGVFGIMKAGAAYVPLDPNAPAKRLAYIMTDCGIEVLVTADGKREGVAECLAEGATLGHVVMTDGPSMAGEEPIGGVPVVAWSKVLNRPMDRFETPSVIETDLAYILYTSGSTGAPKGVMISHRTILTFVNWCQDEFHLTANDRVTSHAPLHFDLSTFDIYATVKAGGTIIPVGERVSALPAQLAELLAQERITITYMVPSILSFMASYGKMSAHDYSCLRMVLFAGEVFPIKHLRKLVAALPGVACYNLYGPTETNVCTFYRVEAGDVAEDRNQPVPIGRCCANMEVFAVDDDGNRVTESGREGELWARGSCVAQGYWGDKEKTSRAFVQNPFNPVYPDIVYRTGDIVTLAPDLTNWLYVGRRDHMVKSRGYRIELGEIENALGQHEGVKEAAAVPVPDEILGNRIIAFVVFANAGTVPAKELEAFCGQRVPKYMVPEKFVVCDALPKTSSGKTDRPALLARLTRRAPTAAVPAGATA